MLTLRRAEEQDVPLFVSQSKRAFDSDVAVGAQGVGGPPYLILNSGTFRC